MKRHIKGVRSLFREKAPDPFLLRLAVRRLRHSVRRAVVQLVGAVIGHVVEIGADECLVGCGRLPVFAAIELAGQAEHQTGMRAFSEIRVAGQGN